MDPVHHTLISTGLLYVAYKIGRVLGTKSGFALGEASVLIMLAQSLNADKIDIDEEKGISVCDSEGNWRKIE